MIGLALILTSALAYLIIRGVSRPITLMTEAMTKLGAGDKTIVVVGLDRGDEIGGMAKALQVFKDTAIEAERLAAEQAAAQEARAKRAQFIEQLTANFDTEATAIVKSVASASTEMQVTASAMTATAEETSRQSTAVAAASEQASANVQTVASAAEELTSSVQEISRQVSESTNIAGDAVAQAGRSQQLVKALSEAAQRIGAVVNLINEIASQTNLLALNATTRQPEPVKPARVSRWLPQRSRVSPIRRPRRPRRFAPRSAACNTRPAKPSPRSVKFPRSSAGSARSPRPSPPRVEEQGAATKEIARNVQQAAQGTQEVSSNIAGVTEAAQHTGTAAAQLLGASGELSIQAETMRNQVEKFISSIKAA